MTVTAEELAVQQELLEAEMVDAVEEMADELVDWQSLSPEQAATEARALIPELVREYGDAASLLAADFYDETRSHVAEAAAFAYAAQLAPVFGDDIVQDELGWALAPFFADDGADITDLDSVFGTVLGRMRNVLQLLVGEQYRDTIGLSAGEDPMPGVLYGRHASANACAFCRLMATRGAGYLSEKSATVVVGEVDPRDIAQRIRGPRGSRQEGEKYHDKCRCVAVAVFPGGTLQEAPYVAQWRKDYKAAAVAAGGTKRANLKTILAHMRENTGAR